MTETELAAAIASGQIGSPAQCGGFSLFALRVTGTGTVWREAHDELAFRPPDEYLTPAFLERVQGLPVVADHPEGAKLDGAEYDQRSIGSCVLPYIATPDGIQADDGTEVWSIARIYSADAVAAMSTLQLSTSPAVIWRKGGEGERVLLPDGSPMLIENAPVILDHLAVCELGVFDRGGPPMGVRFDSKEKVMTDEEKAEAERVRKDAEGGGSNIDKVLAHLDNMSNRLDAIEARVDNGATGILPIIDPRKLGREMAASAAAARSDGAIMSLAESQQKQRAEEGELSETQSRADGAYQSWGLRAAAPMQSEAPIAYRKRMLRGLQRHSPLFKDIDLDVVAADAALLAKAESVIYADAVKASKNPSEEGRQVMIKKVDPDTGHHITTFHGGDTIFKQLAPVAMRVTGFAKPRQHRWD